MNLTMQKTASIYNCRGLDHVNKEGYRHGRTWRFGNTFYAMPDYRCNSAIRFHMELLALALPK